MNDLYNDDADHMSWGFRAGCLQNLCRQIVERGAFAKKLWNSKCVVRIRWWDDLMIWQWNTQFVFSIIALYYWFLFLILFEPTFKNVFCVISYYGGQVNCRATLKINSILCLPKETFHVKLSPPYVYHLFGLPHCHTKFFYLFDIITMK